MTKLPTKNTSEAMGASAQTMLREYAGQRWPTMNHKGRMSRLATVLNWGHRRVKAIYQNDPRARLRADEMAAIEALQLNEARREYRSIEALAAGLEALLAHTDEAGYRPQIDALRQIYRGVDRPGNRG